MCYSNTGTHMKLEIRENYRAWFKLTLIYLGVQTLIRALFILEKMPSIIDSIDAVVDGFAWDLGTWSIASIPFVVLSLLIPFNVHRKYSDSRLDHAVTFIFTLIITFIGFCEIIFWNEFHSRFNFIAVDYLIYTNEVLANARESFPMNKIITGIVTLSLLITFITSKIKFTNWNKGNFLKKVPTFLLFGILIPFSFLFFFGPWLEFHDEDFHDDQISRNGSYEFLRAFRSNKIDYKSFYQTLPDKEVEEYINSKKVSKGPHHFNFGSQKPNVVMIVVESLGAKFIGPLSHNKDTTPYLNHLATESIFFEKFYATGTRTVRGLEALSLSVPPTPGYAVVKRPEHKGLYSLGHTFKLNGYDPLFLYGGRGFFDNMNSFFSGNNFKVVDQGDFKNNEVTFSNAWGVCDEDLFKKADQKISERDKSKPFFLFMLTTSNHRPFTYPEGKIDIPSGTSRAGAVKYTDYAIGTFLRESIKKEWSKNTIFVVVADHSTEGRGRFDLEMRDFHIPLWIYSPSLLKPQVVSKLGSQIDLLPTLIHMLDLKDDSPFFGHSFFNSNWKDERAFIGNYQYVGYYTNNILTTLGPNRTIRNYSFDPVTGKQASIQNSPYLKDAISYYQSASSILDSGRYKHPIEKH